MNLYLLTPIDFCGGYDTYDSVVVCAKSEELAKKIHPSFFMEGNRPWSDSGAWVDSPDKVKVELLGKAIEGSKTGVVLASFNAG